MNWSDAVRSGSEVFGERGVVAAGHPAEAEAGIRMLEAGGNAVDALVSAAFTAFVVEPASCGVGGYGRLSLFLARSREFVTVDHYVRAPKRARPDMFEVDPPAPRMYYGWPRVVGRRNEWGHLAPAVPGAVAGLCAAQEQFGRLPLPEVIEPAIEAAEAGVPITWNLVLAIADRLAEIRTLPHTASLLLREGVPLKAAGLDGVGDRLDFSELAGTLRRIAREGAGGFYTGPVAEAIEREVTANGGILTAADLAAYEPKIVRETPAAYRGLAYVTANDPLGYETLNILEQFDLARYGSESVEFRHVMAEAFAHAFADNMAHYGDPDFTRSPATGLASLAFAAERSAAIRLDRAAPRPVAPGDPWPYEPAADRPEGVHIDVFGARGHGTSQVAVADGEGNAAALITSVSNAFGSLVLVPGTGVFLNDAMQNFDPRPDRANAIAPGKMPIFAAPALVATRDGEAAFAAGGSGGYRIMSGVLHTLVHAVDFGMALQEAVDAPRVHCQGEQTFVDARIAAGVRARLAELGHEVVVQRDVPGTVAFGRVSAVRRDSATGVLSAASGPAWHTAVAGL